MKITKSSGNVYADLGIPDPETHALKAALVYRISEIIESKGFTQTDAADKLHISQPDVSKMLKGQFRAFSLDRLMRFLTVLGQDVVIAVKKPAGKRTQGRMTVQHGEEFDIAASALVKSTMEVEHALRERVVPQKWLKSRRASQLASKAVINPDTLSQKEINELAASVLAQAGSQPPKASKRVAKK